MTVRRTKKSNAVATVAAAPPRERFTPTWYNRIRGAVQHTSDRIENWVDSIRRGELRIPPFQREWVWTDEQILLLLESLVRGDYVGSILLWVRNVMPATSERFGDVSIECPAKIGDHASYVIDGQQRLGALATAFMSGRFFFDLERGAFSTTPGPWHLPLTVVFNVNADWFDWARPHAAEHGLDQNRVTDCTIKAVAMIGDTQLSAIMLPSHWTQARVVDTFEKINSTGTPISSEDLRAALARATSEEVGTP